MFSTKLKQEADNLKNSAIAHIQKTIKPLLKNTNNTQVPYYFLDDIEDYPEIKSFSVKTPQVTLMVLGFSKEKVFLSNCIAGSRKLKDLDLDILIELCVWLDNNFKEYKAYVEHCRSEYDKIQTLKLIAKHSMES